MGILYVMRTFPLDVPYHADEYAIEKCSLLISPQREVKICMLKNPKQKYLAEILSKAHRQATTDTGAEKANLVPAKPKVS